MAVGLRLAVKDLPNQVMSEEATLSPLVDVTVLAAWDVGYVKACQVVLIEVQGMVAEMYVAAPL